jgi:enamine deaminase RidA (YjgF/YER057c/UK114 family)
MSVSASGARQRRDGFGSTRGGPQKPSPLVTPQTAFSTPGASQVSRVTLVDSVRLALMLTPSGRGTFEKQVQELFEILGAALSSESHSLSVTSQTVFLRDPSDQRQCSELLRAYYGKNLPVTTFVYQPPCCGAALAIEAWAVGGPSLKVERFGSHAVSVSYNGVRWIYCGGIQPARGISGVCAQTTDALERLRRTLERAGASFEHIARTWFYLGGITDLESGNQRYKELNRARTEFYRGFNFNEATLLPGSRRPVYPASTGIGMTGMGLSLSCTAFQTERKDAFLLPLENPQQTPAYHYHPRYSPQSPKFSRAMALVTQDWAVTWVSGTASVIDSESCHPGNIEKQTEQTIENIEKLIARENFAASGVGGAGACLSDLAKIRVYVKRPEDFAKCKAVCDRSFGPVPAIYAIADVCRPELLVEIEGVSFSARSNLNGDSAAEKTLSGANTSARK